MIIEVWFIEVFSLSGVLKAEPQTSCIVHTKVIVRTYNEEDFKKLRNGRLFSTYCAIMPAISHSFVEFSKWESKFVTNLFYYSVC